MAIQSPDELFSILEKSNLLNAEQISTARQSVQGLDDATLAARKLARDGLLTRWQAAQLLAGRSSFLLGKYKLIDLLGRGGMGRVFLGRHVTMQRPVALKIVSREVGANPAALERFLAEARAIAVLDHPAIVQAYSVDCEGDRYYIVMEYVDGRDLQRVVEDDGPLDCPMAVDYIRQASDGLAHAHSRKLVHCDIKPSNLLVNSQGQVKILDMGMARLGGGAAEGNGSDNNHILGSVDYLAPEQALGSESFDHRADIYSLGCTLYFLLTGHPPFPEGTLPEKILKHQTQQPRPIPTERPDVPPQLVQVCRRMMAKEPEERYQSADEILEALAEVHFAPGDGQAAKGAPAAAHGTEEFAQDGEPAPVPDSPLAPLRQWLATTVGRLVLGGAVLLMLLLVVGVSVAIVAATGRQPQQPAPDDITAAQPQEPAAPENGEEEETEDEEVDEFDLARAFAERQKAGQAGEPGETPDDQQPQPADPPGDEPAEQPADREEPAADPSDAADPDEPEEPKPEKEPEPPEKPPPKPERPPTFRDFPETPELPPLDTAGGQPEAAEPVVLGKLYVRERAPWIMVLGGGDVVVPNGELTLQRDAAEDGGRAWVFQLTPRDESATDVARLWYEPENNAIRFRWLEGAAQHAGAGQLRLCRLELRIDGESKQVAFSEPAPAPPLGFDLDKRIDRVTIDRDDLPDERHLRLEITKIEGPVEQYQTQPDGPVESRRPLTLAFQRLDRDRNAKPIAVIQINFTVSRKGLTILRRIERPPGRLVPPGPQLAQLRKKGEEDLKKTLEQMRKVEGHAARERFRPILDRIEEGLGHLDLIEKVDGQAVIHYRILLQSGDYQLPLFDSQLWPPADGGAGE